ncbi:hypothetical protein [Streptomyces sp. NPDC054837]
MNARLEDGIPRRRPWSRESGTGASTTAWTRPPIERLLTVPAEGNQIIVAAAAREESLTRTFRATSLPMPGLVADGVSTHGRGQPTPSANAS